MSQNGQLDLSRLANHFRRDAKIKERPVTTPVVWDTRTPAPSSHDALPDDPVHDYAHRGLNHVSSREIRRHIGH